MFLLVFSTLSLLVWFGVGVLGSALGLVVLDSGRDVGGGGVQGEYCFVLIWFGMTWYFCS